LPRTTVTKHWNGCAALGAVEGFSSGQPPLLVSVVLPTPDAGLLDVGTPGFVSPVWLRVTELGVSAVAPGELGAFDVD
jgi:hypothetical protein